jgi:uncharacterized membrane protein YbhN (UPF0104 family)
MRSRPNVSWLGLAISFVSLAAVVWWISRQESPRLPTSASGFAWLALALAVIAGNFGLRGRRWHRIVRHAGVTHRERDVQGLTLVGYMGNNVLPARGGDLLKIGLLAARTGARRRTILGTVMVERLVDAAVLAALFCALTFAGVRGMPSGKGAAIVAAVALAAAGAALAAYVQLRRSGRLERFAALVRPVAVAFRQLAGPAGIPLVLLSGVIWCVDGLTFAIIARAVGIELGAASALAVIVLASLAAAIPAAPGYVGTFDAAMLFGLHGAGVGGGAAVGLLLLARFMFFVPVTFAGLATLVAGYGGLRRGATAEEAVRLEPVGHG